MQNVNLRLVAFALLQKAITKYTTIFGNSS